MNLIETVAVRRGQVQHEPYHLARMHLSAPGLPLPRLQELFDRAMPSADAHTLYKLRLLYNQKQLLRVQAEPYLLRKISRIMLCPIPDTLHYERKWADRQALDAVAARARAPHTAVLMVQNGRITDTTYTNVYFKTKANARPVTPDTPLLAGTMRAYLLDKGLLEAAPITVSDLANFTHIGLINAMIPLGTLELPIRALLPPGNTRSPLWPNPLDKPL